MCSNQQKITREFVLENRYGLHARPSSMFVKTVAEFQSEITVQKDDIVSNGKSIMELMMLAAAPGESLTISAHGDDAAQAMAAIAELFSSKFGEEAESTE